MQPPKLPIQSSDVQWVSSAPATQPTTPVSSNTVVPILFGSIVVIFFLCVLGTIACKRRKTSALQQQILYLEKLWRLESKDPHERYSNNE